MKGQTWQALRWILSLGKKFALVVPLQTIMVVFLTLVGQVSALLASFLPLKVVILLGSERTPHYFPASWIALDRDVLITSLCIGTLGFYLLQLLAERVARGVTGGGAGRLLARSHKMMLFENQDKLAQDAYLRFSRALAAGVFVVLAWVGLGWFYPAMIMVMLSYIVFVGAGLSLLSTTSSTFRERLEEKLANVLAVCAGVGFFVCFAYLVADFLFWQPPGVIIGIVALLLSRQVMQKIASLMVDLVSLKRQQNRLDAIFFHGKALLPTVSSEKSVYWDLLNPERREEWIAALLQEHTTWRSGKMEIRWHPSGMLGVATMLVETDCERYLVKLFDKNRSSLASHEATLLSESMPGLPAFSMLATTQVNSCHCLLFFIPAGSFVDAPRFKRVGDSIYQALWVVRPAASLKSRYQRSRPSLWQRLTPAVLQRTKVAVCSVEQSQMLDQVMLQLPALALLLQRLPLCVSTLDIRPNNLFISEKAEPILLNWTRWYLEPIGAGWPIARLGKLEAALNHAAVRHEALQEVPLPQVEVSALAFALAAACEGQRYNEALDILPPILARLAALGIAE